MNTLEKMLLGGNRAVEFLKIRQDDATPAKRIIEWNGFKVGLQYLPFELRHGKLLTAAYGHIQKTKGADDMALDVYVGTKLESTKVYAIAQFINGVFDEEKIIIGSDSQDEAKAIYLSAMPEEFFGGIRELDINQLNDYRTDSIPLAPAVSKSKEDIRRDFAAGLLSRSDALQLLSYDVDKLTLESDLDVKAPSLPNQTQLPYFWTGGELPETDGRVYAINHTAGGLLAIGYNSEEHAIASAEAELAIEVESSADVTDLLSERIDNATYLDAALKNVKGNLCRDAHGRFMSCGKPTTKVETSLAKSRKEAKAQRDRDLKSALEKTDYSDYKQVEKLGQLFSKQYIKSTAPTPKERQLLKKKNEIADKYLANQQWMSKASEKEVNDAIAAFQTTEKDYFTHVSRRQTRLALQHQELRDAIVKHHGVSKEDIEGLTSMAQYETSLGSRTKKTVQKYHEEFLQLTGGKSATSISSIRKDRDRAYANASGVLNVGKGAHKDAFFHEAAHHVEFESSKLREAANGWLRSKASSTEPELLSKLTGISAYARSEVALPDKFVDPYVGKIYKDRSTEVISMGAEHFTDSKNMQILHERDRRHFEFTLGALLAR